MAECRSRRAGPRPGEQIVARSDGIGRVGATQRAVCPLMGTVTAAATVASGESITGTSLTRSSTIALKLVYNFSRAGPRDMTDVGNLRGLIDEEHRILSDGHRGDFGADQRPDLVRDFRPVM